MNMHVKGLSVAVVLLMLIACAPSESVTQSVSYTSPMTPRSKVEPVAVVAQRLEQQHLQTFDDLDFNVFSNQKWDHLAHSHAQDVIVHWPDGRRTVGIDVHIADLQRLFVYAPDTRIKVHPHKLADKNLTAVSGIMEGTFTEPMPLADGSYVPATGRAFKLPMATIGRWENGVMKEEWLFWDNQSYLAQIGVVP